jgi:PAS domain S-box-containing protein
MSDADGRQTWANEPLIELSGWPAAELRGFGWIMLIHEDDQERIFKEWSAAVLQKRTFQAKCRFRTRSKKVYRGELLASPFFDNGGLAGYTGIATATPARLTRKKIEL